MHTTDPALEKGAFAGIIRLNMFCRRIFREVFSRRNRSGGKRHAHARGSGWAVRIAATAVLALGATAILPATDANAQGTPTATFTRGGDGTIGAGGGTSTYSVTLTNIPTTAADSSGTDTAVLGVSVQLSFGGSTKDAAGANPLTALDVRLDSTQASGSVRSRGASGVVTYYLDPADFVSNGNTLTTTLTTKGGADVGELVVVNVDNIVLYNSTDSTGILFGFAAASILTPTPAITIAQGNTADRTFTVGVSVPSYSTITQVPLVFPTGTAIPTTTLPAAVGGTGTVTYALTPDLPAGLFFDASSREITGNPSATLGTTEFTLTATDSNSASDTLTFNITVSAPVSTPSYSGITQAPLVFTTGTAIPTTTLPAAAGGAGTVTYALAPSLPAGLSFDASSRQITGTPSATLGVTTFTLTATDANSVSTELTFNITVNAVASPPSYSGITQAPLVFTRGTAITTTTLPAATGGTGTVTYALTPSLPAGLSFAASSREITGNPSATLGTTEFTLRATDGNSATADLTFNITVNAPVSTPSYSGITQAPLVFTTGTAIGTETLPAADGGTGTVTYALTPSLPAGLSFAASSRQITGTPSATLVETTFTLTATDANSVSTELTFTITVNAPAVAEDVTSTDLLSLTVGGTSVPGFAVNTFPYGVTLADGTTSAEIVATPAANAPNATILIGAVALEGGSITVPPTCVTTAGANACTLSGIGAGETALASVIVESADENTVVTYTIAIGPVYARIIGGGTINQGDTDADAFTIRIRNYSALPNNGFANIRIDTDDSGFGITSPLSDGTFSAEDTFLQRTETANFFMDISANPGPGGATATSRPAFNREGSGSSNGGTSNFRILVPKSLMAAGVGSNTNVNSEDVVVSLMAKAGAATGSTAFNFGATGTAPFISASDQDYDNVSGALPRANSTGTATVTVAAAAPPPTLSTLKVFVARNTGAAALDQASRFTPAFTAGDATATVYAVELSETNIDDRGGDSGGTPALLNYTVNATSASPANYALICRGTTIVSGASSGNLAIAFGPNRSLPAAGESFNLNAYVINAANVDTTDPFAPGTVNPRSANPNACADADTASSQNYVTKYTVAVSRASTSPATVTVATAQTAVTEGDSAFNITVALDQPVAAGETVTLPYTFSGAGIATTDFSYTVAGTATTGLTGNLVFDATEQSKIIAVTVLDDSTADAGETLNFRLDTASSPYDGVAVEATDEVNIAISDPAVAEDETSADLRSLTVGGTSVPGFAVNTLAYGVTLADGTTSAVIRAITAEDAPRAGMTMSAVSQDGGTDLHTDCSGPADLTCTFTGIGPGETILVTITVGASDFDTFKAYTIAIGPAYARIIGDATTINQGDTDADVFTIRIRNYNTLPDGGFASIRIDTDIPEFGRISASPLENWPIATNTFNPTNTYLQTLETADFNMTIVDNTGTADSRLTRSAFDREGSGSGANDRQNFRITMPKTLLAAGVGSNTNVNSEDVVVSLMAKADATVRSTSFGFGASNNSNAFIAARNSSYGNSSGNELPRDNTSGSAVTVTVPVPPGPVFASTQGDLYYAVSSGAIEDVVLPAASGGTGAISYAFGLPAAITALGNAGLSYDAGTRTISGTPTGTLNEEFTYTATDSTPGTALTRSVTFSIVIVPAPTVTLAKTGSTDDITAGSTDSRTFTVTLSNIPEQMIDSNDDLNDGTRGYNTLKQVREVLLQLNLNGTYTDLRDISGSTGGVETDEWSIPAPSLGSGTLRVSETGATRISNRIAFDVSSVDLTDTDFVLPDVIYTFTLTSKAASVDASDLTVGLRAVAWLDDSQDRILNLPSASTFAGSPQVFNFAPAPPGTATFARGNGTIAAGGGTSTFSVALTDIPANVSGTAVAAVGIQLSFGGSTNAAASGNPLNDLDVTLAGTLTTGSLITTIGSGGTATYYLNRTAANTLDVTVTTKNGADAGEVFVVNVDDINLRSTADLVEIASGIGVLTDSVIIPTVALADRTFTVAAAAPAAAPTITGDAVTYTGPAANGTAITLILNYDDIDDGVTSNPAVTHFVYVSSTGLSNGNTPTDCSSGETDYTVNVEIPIGTLVGSCSGLTTGQGLRTSGPPGATITFRLRNAPGAGGLSEEAILTFAASTPTVDTATFAAWDAATGGNAVPADEDPAAIPITETGANSIWQRVTLDTALGAGETVSLIFGGNPTAAALSNADPDATISEDLIASSRSLSSIIMTGGETSDAFQLGAASDNIVEGPEYFQISPSTFSYTHGLLGLDPTDGLLTYRIDDATTTNATVTLDATTVDEGGTLTATVTLDSDKMLAEAATFVLERVDATDGSPTQAEDADVSFVTVAVPAGVLGASGVATVTITDSDGVDPGESFKVGVDLAASTYGNGRSLSDQITSVPSGDVAITDTDVVAEDRTSADLRSLTVGGTSVPGFAVNTFPYGVTLADGTTSAEIIATPALDAPNATIIISAVALDEGTDTYTDCTTTAGANTCTFSDIGPGETALVSVLVESADGNTTAVYTIAIGPVYARIIGGGTINQGDTDADAFTIRIRNYSDLPDNGFANIRIDTDDSGFGITSPLSGSGFRAQDTFLQRTETANFFMDISANPGPGGATATSRPAFNREGSGSSNGGTSNFRILVPKSLMAAGVGSNTNVNSEDVVVSLMAKAGAATGSTAFNFGATGTGPFISASDQDYGNNSGAALPRANSTGTATVTVAAAAATVPTATFARGNGTIAAGGGTSTFSVALTDIPADVSGTAVAAVGIQLSFAGSTNAAASGNPLNDLDVTLSSTLANGSLRAVSSRTDGTATYFMDYADFSSNANTLNLTVTTKAAASENDVFVVTVDDITLHNTNDIFALADSSTDGALTDTIANPAVDLADKTFTVVAPPGAAAFTRGGDGTIAVGGGTSTFDVALTNIPETVDVSGTDTTVLAVGIQLSFAGSTTDAAGENPLTALDVTLFGTLAHGDFITTFGSGGTATYYLNRTDFVSNANTLTVTVTTKNGADAGEVFVVNVDDINLHSSIDQVALVNSRNVLTDSVTIPTVALADRTFTVAAPAPAAVPTITGNAVTYTGPAANGGDINLVLNYNDHIASNVTSNPAVTHFVYVSSTGISNPFGPGPTDCGDDDIAANTAILITELVGTCPNTGNQSLGFAGNGAAGATITFRLRNSEGDSADAVMTFAAATPSASTATFAAWTGQTTGTVIAADGTPAAIPITEGATVYARLMLDATLGDGETVGASPGDPEAAALANADPDATIADDLDTTSSSVYSIISGEDAGSNTFTASSDSIVEGPEYFQFDLGAITYSHALLALTPANGILTFRIEDDTETDATVTLASTVTEGATDVEVTITLDTGITLATDAIFTLRREDAGSGTQAQDADVSFPSTITITAGQSSGSANITITGSDSVDAGESFKVGIASADYNGRDYGTSVTFVSSDDVAITDTGAPNDASLADLTAGPTGGSAVAFTTAYSQAAVTNAYEVNLPFGTANVDVVADPNTAAAVVTSITGTADGTGAADTGSALGGQVNTAGAADATITANLTGLVTGRNTIEVLVTAGDTTTQRTYTLTATVAAPRTTATLSDLELRTVAGAAETTIVRGAGCIAGNVFAEGCTTYTARFDTVPGGNTAHITPVSREGSTFVVSNGTASGDGFTVPVSLGFNTITVTVTPEDGDTSSNDDYTIALSIGNHDTSLGTLSVTQSGESAVPATGTGLTRTVNLFGSADTGSITIDPTDANARVSAVTGSNITVASANTGSDNTATHALTDIVDSSSIRFTVTSQSGITADYTLRISLPVQEVDNADLGSLTVGTHDLSTGEGGAATFDADVLNYGVTLPDGTTTATITATPDAAANNADITIAATALDGGTIGTSSCVATTSGAATCTITGIGAGETAVATITVVSDDSSVTKIYTVAIGPVYARIIAGTTNFTPGAPAADAFTIRIRNYNTLPDGGFANIRIDTNIPEFGRISTGPDTFWEIADNGFTNPSSGGSYLQELETADFQMAIVDNTNIVDSSSIADNRLSRSHFNREGSSSGANDRKNFRIVMPKTLLAADVGNIAAVNSEDVVIQLMAKSDAMERSTEFEFGGSTNTSNFVNASTSDYSNSGGNHIPRANASGNAAVAVAFDSATNARLSATVGDVTVGTDIVTIAEGDSATNSTGTVTLESTDGTATFSATTAVTGATVTSVVITGTGSPAAAAVGGASPTFTSDLSGLANGGTYEIVVRVTASDTTTTRDYTIALTIEDPADDATLAVLTVDGTTPTGFDADAGTGGTIVAGIGTTSITLVADPNSDNADITTITATDTDSNTLTVTVTGGALTTDGDTVTATVAVVNGANDIVITVTPTTGAAVVYTVEVTVPEATPADLRLTSLNVDGTAPTGFDSAAGIGGSIEVPVGTTGQVVADPAAADARILRCQFSVDGGTFGSTRSQNGDNHTTTLNPQPSAAGDSFNIVHIVYRATTNPIIAASECDDSAEDLLARGALRYTLAVTYSAAEDDADLAGLTLTPRAPSEGSAETADASVDVDASNRSVAVSVPSGTTAATATATASGGNATFGDIVVGGGVTVGATAHTDNSVNGTPATASARISNITDGGSFRFTITSQSGTAIRYTVTISVRAEVIPASATLSLTNPVIVERPAGHSLVPAIYALEITGVPAASGGGNGTATVSYTLPAGGTSYWRTADLPIPPSSSISVLTPVTYCASPAETANSGTSIDFTAAAVNGTITRHLVFCPADDGNATDETRTFTITGVAFNDTGSATDIAQSAILGAGVSNGGLSVTVVDDDKPANDYRRNCTTGSIIRENEGCFFSEGIFRGSFVASPSGDTDHGMIASVTNRPDARQSGFYTYQDYGILSRLDGLSTTLNTNNNVWILNHAGVSMTYHIRNAAITASSIRTGTLDADAGEPDPLGGSADDGIVMFSLTTGNDINPAGAIVSFSLGGTATYPDDYTISVTDEVVGGAAAAAVTLPVLRTNRGSFVLPDKTAVDDSDRNIVFTITPRPDAMASEGDETVIIRITGVEYTADDDPDITIASSPATINITDGPAAAADPAVVRLERSETRLLTGAEATPLWTIAVENPANTDAVTIGYEISVSPARTIVTDYAATVAITGGTPASATLTSADDEIMITPTTAGTDATATISIDPINLVASDTIALQIASVSGGGLSLANAVLPADGRTVNIEDDAAAVRLSTLTVDGSTVTLANDDSTYDATIATGKSSVEIVATPTTGTSYISSISGTNVSNTALGNPYTDTATGEVTHTLTGLEAGANTVNIVVTDTSGNTQPYVLTVTAVANASPGLVMNSITKTGATPDSAEAATVSESEGTNYPTYNITLTLPIQPTALVNLLYEGVGTAELGDFEFTGEDYNLNIGTPPRVFNVEEDLDFDNDPATPDSSGIEPNTGLFQFSPDLFTDEVARFGEVTFDLRVFPAGDALPEGDETVIVKLIPADFANVHIPGVSVFTTTTVTIEDDDAVTSTPDYSSVTQAPLTFTMGTAITTTTLPAAAGGVAPVTYALTPTLPAGLTFTPASRQISGNPSATLSSTEFTLTATDSNSASDTLTFNITVNAPTATPSYSGISQTALTLTMGTAITATTLPAATGGTGGLTYTLMRTTNPVTLAVAIPDLSFDASSREISGTPNAATSGAVGFTLRATDTNSATADLTFNITVNAAPVFSGTENARAFTQGTAITAFTLPAATGGTGTLTYSATVPPGLSFNITSREITGTPTTVAGSTTYTMTATDTNGATATRDFDITVNAPSSTPSYAGITQTAQTYTAGRAASVTLPAATGGTGGLTYTLMRTTNPVTLTVAIPDLSFDAATRIISGTPNAATSGAIGFTLTATDSNSASDTLTFNITVNAPPAFSGTETARTFTMGAAITAFTLPAVDANTGTAPVIYSATVPPDLSFNITTREITGTPSTAAASTTYTMTATDANGATATRDFDITVNAAPTFSGTATAQTFTQGVAITAFTLPEATGGTGTLTYSATVPPGLSFDPASRQISGTPTVAAASTTYTMTATDTNGAEITLDFDIIVNPALTFGSRTQDDLLYTVMTGITAFTLPAATGGTGTVTYSATVPPGLSFNTGTREITGTPTTAAASTPYRMTATDTNGATAMLDFNITVIARNDPVFSGLEPPEDVDVPTGSVLVDEGLFDDGVDPDTRDYTANIPSTTSVTFSPRLNPGTRYTMRIERPLRFNERPGSSGLSTLAAATCPNPGAPLECTADVGRTITVHGLESGENPPIGLQVTAANGTTTGEEITFTFTIAGGDVRQETEAIAMIVGRQQVGLVTQLIRGRVAGRPAGVAPGIGTTLSLAESPETMQDFFSQLALEHSSESDSGGEYAVWARGQYVSISGSPELAGDPNFEYDGDISGAGFGIERRQGNTLVGLSLNFSSADIKTESGTGGKSTYKETVTFFAPYASYEPDNTSLTLWGTAGAGFGSAKINSATRPEGSPSVQVFFANAGVDYATPFARNSEIVFGLSALSISKTVETFTLNIDPIPRISSDIFQARGDMTLFMPVNFGRSVVRPYIGLTSVHDIGDVTDNDKHAMEGKAGVSWLTGRVTVDVNAFTQFLREDEKAWGVFGEVSYAGVGDLDGLIMGMSGEHGTSSSMSDAVTATNTASGEINTDLSDANSGIPEWSLGMDAEYGFSAPVLHRDGRATPFLRGTHAGDAQTLGSGLRLDIDGNVGVTLESNRYLPADDAPYSEHAVGLEARWAF